MRLARQVWSATVTIDQSEIVAFLAADKVVLPATLMRWTRRNPNSYIARLPVEFRGMRVGELFLMASVATERCWRFKLLRQRAEILRWDFTVPPSRHRNALSCGAGFERNVYDLEHEHLWQPGEGLECATGLTGLADLDHRGALEAFSRRAKIDMQAPYVSPPQLSEQLAFDDKRS